MLTFNYEAKNSKTGETVKAQVQADNEQNAYKLIKEQGLVPLTVKPENVGIQRKFSRIKTKDKVLLRLIFP